MKEKRTREMTISHRQQLGDGRYRITIAANDEARTGPELDLSGLHAENYMRNPVVLWSHGRDVNGNVPIAKTTGLKIGAGVEAEFSFADGDPFAERIRNLWDQGIIRAHP